MSQVEIHFAADFSSLTDLADMIDMPAAQTGYRYWLSNCSNNQPPMKKDILPEEIPPECFPHIHMLEVVENGRDFRVLIVGESVTRSQGIKRGDLASSFVDRIDSLPIMYRYRKVLETKAPVLQRYQFAPLNSRLRKHVQTVTCPLRSQFGEISHLIGFGDVKDYAPQHSSEEGSQAFYLKIIE